MDVRDLPFIFVRADSQTATIATQSVDVALVAELGLQLGGCDYDSTTGVFRLPRGVAEFVLDVDTAASAGNTVEVKVQKSTDGGSTFTDVSELLLTGSGDASGVRRDVVEVESSDQWRLAVSNETDTDNFTDIDLTQTGTVHQNRQPRHGRHEVSTDADR